MDGEFYKILNELTSDIMTETDYLANLESYVQQGLKMIDIENIKKIISLLQKMKKDYAYKGTILLYTKQTVYDSLKPYMKSVKSILDLDLDSPEDRIMNQNIIEIKKYTLESFRYLQSFTPIYADVTSKQKCPLAVTESNNKEELLSRFDSITQYFKVPQLSYFNIKKISREELIGMKYEKLHSYYLDIINMINMGIEKITKTCDIYIDVEKGYLVMKILKDPNVATDNYDVYIDVTN
uniref:Uncharacterized protein n=1 Tax=viral metagenome TaxID=1070528 RepID=A0A6C0EA97_9ZZZZ